MRVLLPSHLITKPSSSAVQCLSLSLSQFLFYFPNFHTSLFSSFCFSIYSSTQIIFTAFYSYKFRKLSQNLFLSFSWVANLICTNFEVNIPVSLGSYSGRIYFLLFYACPLSLHFSHVLKLFVILKCLGCAPVPLNFTSDVISKQIIKCYVMCLS